MLEGLCGKLWGWGWGLQRVLSSAVFGGDGSGSRQVLERQSINLCQKLVPFALQSPKKLEDMSLESRKIGDPTGQVTSQSLAKCPSRQGSEIPEFPSDEDS